MENREAGLTRIASRKKACGLSDPRKGEELNSRSLAIAGKGSHGRTKSPWRVTLGATSIFRKWKHKS